MARGKKKVSLYNPNTTPVVFDKEGRIVGGGERVEVDAVGEVAQDAVDAGLLVLEDEDGPVHESADSPQAADKEASGASVAKKAP